ncbi:MAG: hypothetical protein ACOZQL_34495 [Myxococcota bacterium]
MRLALVLLVVLVGSCTRNVRPTSKRAECEACLAAGRVWTGGRCADQCLMDVSCFKPGMTCPEHVQERTDF